MDDPVDISRALLIEGWMNEPDLHWLATEAQKHDRIVEFGSYLGRSTRALCDNARGWVLAVDDWWGPRDVDVEHRSNLLERFKANLAGVPCKLRIAVSQHSNSKLLDLVASLEPDMVFLDGDHQMEPVRQQVSFFSRRLKSGSLLCGHDASSPAVYAAIHGERGTVTIAPGTDIWYERF